MLQKQQQIKLTSKEKQELEAMEGIILDLEQQIETINDKMNEYQDDFNKLVELSNLRDDLVKQLDSKMNVG